jgi:hypothetical protein
MFFNSLKLAGISCLVGVSSLSAQQPACQAEEYSQFDFWIGTWNVVTANGTQAGRNTIEKVQGCYLHESWTGAGGNRGNSYNIYDQTSGKWHQTWVDNGGTLLQIDGEFVDGSMVLEGETTGRSGAVTLNRISWTAFTADSVQQLWETSSDGGSSWTTAFDGRYVRE